MAREYHVCLSVRGFIVGPDKDLLNLFLDPDSGRRLAPPEARNLLMDQLKAGREVLPFGPPCEGFDYSGGGCPGHDVEAPHGPQA